jgi:predicted amidophosphoribosyltransferase
VLGALLDLLAPPACAVCRTPVDAGLLCGACVATLPWLRDPCPRCALPRPCAPCPASRASFSSAAAAVAHAGPARDLLLALKVRGMVEAAGVMAAHLGPRMPPVPEGAVLVPVPPDPVRKRRRGLDAAELLATALARRTGRPCVRALARQAAARQVGRGRADRAARTGIRAVLAVDGPVVLVDDVHTTGATLDSAARALRAAGSPHVAAVTYARTVTGP